VPSKKTPIDPKTQSVDQLKRSEATFRAIFETSAVGIGIMGLDRKILDANPSICRMFGLTREEFIGKEPAFATYPEDYPESTRQFQELLEGRRESYLGERRYIRKNGEVFLAHVTMSVVRNKKGVPLYMVGMVIDINDRKSAMEELLASEARFKAMFDNTSVGIALTGLDRRILQVNEAAARITGYPMEELTKLNPIDLALPEDRHVADEALVAMVAGKRDSMTVERRYMRKSGEIFWGRVTYSLVRGPDRQPMYLIGLIEDINEQKIAAQKLAQQEAEYRQTLEQRVKERTRELSEANLKLINEIGHRHKAEEALASKAAEEAIAAERTRLARDLHDAVTQTLFSASLIAEVLPEIWELDPLEARRSTEELRQLTRGALAEMRTLLLELRPAALTQAKFPDLLRQLSEAVIGRARLPVQLDVRGEYEMPPEVKVAFYRIAQESLNNVVKYARATQVEIKLIQECCDVHLEIQDNGIGFDQASIKPTSLGMRIMRERAEVIHAHLSVNSSPGQGTKVILDWNEEELIPLSKITTRG
jgi:PAS domain S-box-containing protein